MWSGFPLGQLGDGLAYGADPLLAVFVDPIHCRLGRRGGDTLPWLCWRFPRGPFGQPCRPEPVIAVASTRCAPLRCLLLARSSSALPDLAGPPIIIVLLNAVAVPIYFSGVERCTRLRRYPRPRTGKRDPGSHRSRRRALQAQSSGQCSSPPPKPCRSWPTRLRTPGLVRPLHRLPSRNPYPRRCPRFLALHAGRRPALLFADRRLRVLLFLVASLAGLQGMESGVLVLLATTKWGVSQGAYGLFLATGAAGALLGSFLADGIAPRFGAARSLIAAAIASGVGYLVMASAKSWMLAGPAFAVVGLAVGAGSVVAMSLRQRLTPSDLMGRVGGAWRGLVWGAAPLRADCRRHRHHVGCQGATRRGRHRAMRCCPRSRSPPPEKHRGHAANPSHGPAQTLVA